MQALITFSHSNRCSTTLWPQLICSLGREIHQLWQLSQHLWCFQFIRHRETHEWEFLQHWLYWPRRYQWWRFKRILQSHGWVVKSPHSVQHQYTIQWLSRQAAREHQDLAGDWHDSPIKIADRMLERHLRGWIQSAILSLSRRSCRKCAHVPQRDIRGSRWLLWLRGWRNRSFIVSKSVESARRCDCDL